MLVHGVADRRYTRLHQSNRFCPLLHTHISHKTCCQRYCWKARQGGWKEWKMLTKVILPVPRKLLLRLFPASDSRWQSGTSRQGERRGRAEEMRKIYCRLSVSPPYTHTPKLHPSNQTPTHFPRPTTLPVSVYLPGPAEDLL